MLGIAIELRTLCAKCGLALPINACAERYVCASCGGTTEIDADRWKSLVEDAIEAIPDLGEGEGKNSSIMTPTGTYQLMYGRQLPRCRGCKTPLPEEAFAFVDRGWTVCVHCGQRLTMRRAPAALAAVGVTIVVGEDPAQIAGTPAGATAAAPAAAQPTVLYCPQCKAPLSVDGKNRMVKCQYCSTDVYLPDELWQRLHPVAAVARWHLCLADVDLAAHRLKSWEWSGLSDLLIDANQNIYCVGSGSGFTRKAAVWCMGPDMKTRWFQEYPDYKDDDTHLALDARTGRLLLWQENKHSLSVLSAADGAVLGKMGGKEPDGATTHALDLDDGKWLRVDVDGTILALLGERLVRFAEDGTPIATWPPRSGLFGKKAEKLKPLYAAGHERIDVDGVYLEHVGSQPTALDDYTNLHLGWDGRLYGERSEWIACFDRSGERVYRIKLPVEDVRGHYLGTDAAGSLYALCSVRGTPSQRALIRVSPDGKKVDIIATDRRSGGVIGDEDRLLVAPDGTIFMISSGRDMRVLAPDGRLLFISESSREDDADDDKEIAANA